MRRIAVTVLAALTSASAVMATEPMTFASAREITDRRGVDPVTGIWRIGTDGATVAILPDAGTSGHFTVYLLDSPDYSVIPGSKIGSAVATGSPATYDAELIKKNRFADRRQRFIINLDGNGHLKFRSYTKGKQITLWRWLPYLFRMTVKDRNTRPESSDGAIRIYPENISPSPVLL